MLTAIFNFSGLNIYKRFTPIQESPKFQRLLEYECFSLTALLLYKSIVNPPLLVLRQSQIPQ